MIRTDQQDGRPSRQERTTLRHVRSFGMVRDAHVALSPWRYNRGTWTNRQWVLICGPDGWEVIRLLPEVFTVNPKPQPNLLQMYPGKDFDGNEALELTVNSQLVDWLPNVSGRVGLIGTSSRISGGDLRFDDYRFVGQNCTFAPEPGGSLEYQAIERPNLSQLLSGLDARAESRFALDMGSHDLGRR